MREQNNPPVGVLGCDGCHREANLLEPISPERYFSSSWRVWTESEDVHPDVQVAEFSDCRECAALGDKEWRRVWCASTRSARGHCECCKKNAAELEALPDIEPVEGSWPGANFSFRQSKLLFREYLEGRSGWLCRACSQGAPKTTEAPAPTSL